jgi:hypothetical protein
MDDLYLIHYGVKGQKWGVRRYQNSDGSLTQLGQEHYGTDSSRSQKLKKAALVTAGILATGVAMYALYNSPYGQQAVSAGKSMVNKAKRDYAYRIGIDAPQVKSTAKKAAYVSNSSKTKSASEATELIRRANRLATNKQKALDGSLTVYKNGKAKPMSKLERTVYAKLADKELKSLQKTGKKGGIIKRVISSKTPSKTIPSLKTVDPNKVVSAKQATKKGNAFTKLLMSNQSMRTLSDIHKLNQQNSELTNNTIRFTEQMLTNDDFIRSFANKY